MNFKPLTSQPEARESMQRILRLPAVLQVTGLARSTVYRMMAENTFPAPVQRAAREFAQAELGDHRYVTVLHDHQANPHVHISVRAESRHGTRLNPRKADLQRWRETFAEKLRGWGIDAEATRQRTRGQVRNYEPIWRVKAAAEGRLDAPMRARSRVKESTRIKPLRPRHGAGSSSVCPDPTALGTDSWACTSIGLSRTRSPSIPNAYSSRCPSPGEILNPSVRR